MATERDPGEGTGEGVDPAEPTSDSEPARDAPQSSVQATVEARFGHVHVIARDWRALASFYEQLFGCRPVPPERDYRGAGLDAGTGLTGAHLRGVHLQLPGYGDGGPTLEIYRMTARSMVSRRS